MFETFLLFIFSPPKGVKFVFHLLQKKASYIFSPSFYTFFLFSLVFWPIYLKGVRRGVWKNNTYIGMKNIENKKNPVFPLINLKNLRSFYWLVSVRFRQIWYWITNVNTVPSIKRNHIPKADKSILITPQTTHLTENLTQIQLIRGYLQKNKCLRAYKETVFARSDNQKKKNTGICGMVQTSILEI